MMAKQQLSYNHLVFSGWALMPSSFRRGLVGQGGGGRVKLTQVTGGEWHLRAFVIQ